MTASPGMPVIRIHLERFQHSLLAMISEQETMMDEYIRQAIEDFCEPDSLQLYINELVAREAEAAIKAEVESFYRYGKGRSLIKEAIIKRLSEE